MEEQQVDGVVTGQADNGDLEVKMNDGSEATVPAEAVVGAPRPPTIAESEVAEHRASLDGSKAKEIKRRMEIDPHKSEAEVTAEYDAKLAEEAKKAHPAAGTGIAHSSEAGVPVDQQ